MTWQRVYFFKKKIDKTIDIIIVLPKFDIK